MISKSGSRTLRCHAFFLSALRWISMYSVWHALIAVLLVVCTIYAMYDESQVEGFESLPPFGTLAQSLTASEKAGLATVGNIASAKLILGQQQKIKDCSFYTDILQQALASSKNLAINDPGDNMLMAYLTEKNPGFLPGFFLSMCSRNAPPPTPSAASIQQAPALPLMASQHAPAPIPTVSARPTLAQLPKQMLGIGQSGQCLTVLNGKYAEKNDIVQWPCNAQDANQKWKVVKIPNGAVQINSSKDSTFCMGMDGTDNGARVRLTKCIDPSGPVPANQLFDLDGSSSVLKSFMGNKCMDINWGIKYNNGHVQVWGCNGWKAAQQVISKPV
jgi:hypothetical protein